MTLTEKANKITEAVKCEASSDPLHIFINIAKKDFVDIHGPEHHILDGACLLTAYKNAGGNIDLDSALSRLCEEGLKMPGGMCGRWGICGAVTSMGVVLSIIDGTGPLTSDGSWGNHMQYTAAAAAELGTINGPRCCKRDAMTAFKHAIKYINDHYDVSLPVSEFNCGFSPLNKQCIKERCPYYGKN